MELDAKAMVGGPLEPQPTSPEHLRSWAECMDEIAKQWDAEGSTGIVESAAAIAFRNAADELERLRKALGIIADAPGAKSDDDLWLHQHLARGAL